jgi:hypothetical protein
MLGKNFPVSEFLRPHIVDAITISRSGGWWAAVLLIQDPKTQKPYLALYRWQKRAGQWKKSSSFKINSAEHLTKIQGALGELGPQLATSPSEEE